jgi:hypothetical protein
MFGGSLANCPIQSPLIVVMMTTLSGTLGTYALIDMNLMKYCIKGSLGCCMWLKRFAIVSLMGARLSSVGGIGYLIVASCRPTTMHSTN